LLDQLHTVEPRVSQLASSCQVKRVMELRTRAASNLPSAFDVIDSPPSEYR
jgi:hypothetical protein